MPPVFLSLDARRRTNWSEAFPDLVGARLDNPPRHAGLIWLLKPAGLTAEDLVAQARRTHPQCPLIVLADLPSETEAMAALAAGAAGYCNGHAAPEVLKQVAMVVKNGGVWVGQGLLQRLLASTARLLPDPSTENSTWREALTAREQEAALLLAKGASNKEIARQLDITERTVKAHVSAMLEKLGARDRMQLSLIINGVEKPR